MMEPHWNEIDTEVVVLEGRGMVRVSNPSITKEKLLRLEVEQGDVFVVPKFNPAAQMAFNNGSFVYMGFTRMTQRSKPKFITGKTSVLQLLSKDVLRLSFNVKTSTLDELLAPRNNSVISPCISCAEEEMQIMKHGPREDEPGSRRHHGGGGGEQEERERHEEEAERRQRERGEEEAERQQRERGEEEAERQQRERGEEEAEREQRERREETGWRHGGHEEKVEAQPNNHHQYLHGDGGRRILKRN